MPTGLSVWLDSYRAGLRESLELAAAHGYRLVHAATTRPDFDPGEFPPSARRHLRKFLRDLGLSIAALAADFPGLGLAEPSQAERRLDHVRDMLALCADLGVRRAGVNLAGLAQNPRSSLPGQMLSEVADLADRIGIETSIHDATTPLTESAGHVRATGCPLLRVAVDSGRVLDAAGGAPAAGLVGTVYLRDVRRQGEQIEEVPYGRGDVDLPALITLPDVLEGRAGLVVRRLPEAGVDALRQGREYIESLLGRSPAR